MDASKPVALVLFDQSAASWDSRKFVIGVDTDVNDMGSNRIELVPQLSFWETPMHYGEMNTMAGMH